MFNFLFKKKYPCPCCGYLVHDAPAGSDEICKICYWHDDYSQLVYLNAGGANEVSLIQGQINFSEFGACEKRLIEYVQKPTKNDKKDPIWRPVNTKTDHIKKDVPSNYLERFNEIDTNRTPYYWKD